MSFFLIKRKNYSSAYILYLRPPTVLNAPFPAMARTLFSSPNTPLVDRNKRLPAGESGDAFQTLG